MIDVQIGEDFNIPFLYSDSSGDPISGQSVRINIYNITNNSHLINNATMVESANVAGLYLYPFINNISTKLNLLIVASVNTQGSKWPVVSSFFMTISHSEKYMADKIDPSDGRAV